MPKFEFQCVTLVHGRIREHDGGTFADKDGKDVDWCKIVVDYFGGFCILKPSPEEYAQMARRLRVGDTIEAAGQVKSGAKGLEMKQFVYIKDGSGQTLLTETPQEASANVPGAESLPPVNAAPAPPRKANILDSVTGRRQAA
jgi:hypothetical protein